jgi:ATP-dependent metalloprotease FtsH
MIRIDKNSNRTKSIYSNKSSKIKLKDIAGLDYAKEEVFEFIDFLKNRDKYIKKGARMPRGALFYGPPGTGKTLLAKAISGESNVNFLSATGSDFVEVYVGVGASRIRDLFNKARKQSPCVLFIDEIDALGRKRSSCSTSGGNSERDNTLNKFLVELDGFEENDNIIVFGATNRLDIIDDALLRPGRFDRKIRFELPEKSERKKIFNYYLSKLNLKDNIEDVTKRLSNLSFGFSGADISNICNEACILSVRNNYNTITYKMLENAIDNVILGPEKKTFRLNDKERKIIAYHEAGHTVMSYLLEHTTKPIKVSIMPRGKSALGFSQREMSDNKLKTKDEILDDICVLLGGRVSEEIFMNNITTGAYDDIQKLTELAYMFVSIYGMDDDFRIFYYNSELKNRYSENIKKQIDETVKNIINDCYKKTKEMLNNKKEFVEKIAVELLRNETLNQNQLNLIKKNI